MKLVGGLDPRTPVIVGVGQANYSFPAPEPVVTLAESIRRAAGGGAAVLCGLQSIQVVRTGTRGYSDPGRLVARELGIDVAETVYSEHGGQTPQALINAAAWDIWTGRVDGVAIGGAETWRTRRLLKKVALEPEWTKQDRSQEPSRRSGKVLEMVSPYERSLGFVDPVQAYPIFETAVRAASGRAPAEHTEHIARMWSRMSEVAVTNPYARIPKAYSPQEIANVGPSNRLVAHPYTKLMVSNNDVDQSAAIIMYSVGQAEAMGIDRDAWIFLHGAGEANESQFVTGRASLHSSPAIACAGRAALDQAQVVIDDIDHFDIYSCFPSAVEIARRELRVPEGKALTVTGGLTFAGGPWNNYVTHSVAAMVDLLREHPEALGMCTANGGMLTKHAIGIYGARPPAADPRPVVMAPTPVPRPVVEEFSGSATILGYTVTHARDGSALKAFVVGEDAQGRHMMATSEIAGVLDDLEQTEGVGQTATIEGGRLVRLD